MYYESKQTSIFTSSMKNIAPQGTLSQQVEYEFNFKNIEKEYESYRGINVDTRYYLRVTIMRSMFNITQEQEFWVHHKQERPKEQDKGIDLEVGLEGIVLLAIKYDKVYHEIKRGCIEGKLRFYLVKEIIDKAEVSIIKQEISGVGEYAVTEQEVLKKFEVIDGTPAEGFSIIILS